jgi:hypothetical protein
MSNPENSATAVVLTPSERVLLFGDRFARPGGMLGTNEVVLSSEARVNADDLVDPVIAAAILASEQAGAVRLEERHGKALFGLVKTHALHVLPGARQVEWPEGSLESRVVQIAREQPKVADLVTRLLGGKESNALVQELFSRMKSVLAARGVLHAEEKKTLKVFTSVSYSLPAEARAAAERDGTEQAKALLDACRGQRPEIWKYIMQGSRPPSARSPRCRTDPAAGDRNDFGTSESIAADRSSGPAQDEAPPRFLRGGASRHPAMRVRARWRR